MEKMVRIYRGIGGKVSVVTGVISRIRALSGRLIMAASGFCLAAGGSFMRGLIL
jgi:hypothetical protein